MGVTVAGLVWHPQASQAGFSYRQLRFADVTKLQKHSAQDSWKMKQHLYSPSASIMHVFVADLQLQHSGTTNSFPYSHASYCSD